MKVKLCGFKDQRGVEAAIAAKCDFIGFIFHEKSPRFVTLEVAKKISSIIPANIAKVAVVVDKQIADLQKIISEFQPEYVQFHGSESVEFLKVFKEKFPQVKIIKALSIQAKSDLEKVNDFVNIVDFFLFDNKTAGSGISFDWEILRGFSCAKDWFLSGGLNAKNIEQALEITGAKMVDISSGIEEIRGEKSAKLIAEFMAKIKKHG